VDIKECPQFSLSTTKTSMKFIYLYILSLAIKNNLKRETELGYDNKKHKHHKEGQTIAKIILMTLVPIHFGTDTSSFVTKITIISIVCRTDKTEVINKVNHSLYHSLSQQNQI
jgi:hypothetical protein